MAKGKPVSLRRGPKGKGGTASSRHHHFEGFSQRIAKINIDPVRRVRRHGLEDDLSTTDSYFKIALDEWRELNLSEHFAAFALAVQPLCDTLPQLLHHQDAVMDLMVEYIEKEDALSLEPILSLMSHFAHDLGARFEKHFARAVSLITQVASRHQNIEVIEWSFTCLAWLLKYLSRLLVPDLRPVYDLLSPLLGKERQKPFVVRFAAEALSFLMRKAGSAYHRKPEQLETILKHIVADLNAQDPSEQHFELFLAGIMTLLVESIQGVQRSIHSSGLPIFHELTRQVFNSAASDPEVHSPTTSEQAICGALVAIIHHTDSATFGPLLDQLLEDLDTETIQRSHQACVLACRLLFLVAGVRHGNRVERWGPLVSKLGAIVHMIETSRAQPGTEMDALATLAVVLQSCPLDRAIPEVRLLQHLTNGRWKPYFLPFCAFFAELGSERFQSLLLPQLKRFISTGWAEHGKYLCVVLPQLYHSGCFADDHIAAPISWQKDILSRFEGLQVDSSDALAIECAAYLETLEMLQVETSTEEQVTAKLSSSLRAILESTSDRGQSCIARFACGAGFKYLMQKGKHKLIGESTWRALCHRSEDFRAMPLFWEAMLAFVQESGSKLDLKGQHMELLLGQLLACISAPSRDLRHVALRILNSLHQIDHGGPSDLLTMAISIEESPLTVEASRTVSMQTRRFGIGYESASRDELLGEVIPRYCFGLLHFRMTPVWDEACESLKAISGTKKGENIISELSCKWLDGSPASKPVTSITRSPHTDSTDRKSTRASEFECSHANRLSAMVESCKEQAAGAADQFSISFDERHASAPLTSPTNRAQALRVLSKISSVAEKRSRDIVPVLLRWAEAPAQDALEDADLVEETTSADVTERWSRKDQKAMLSLFALFRNPKTLFKSGQVYEALLALLTNGDVEIQKSALKALMTWKLAAINRYEEHLMGLLDDAKFREQISVFLDISEDNNLIQYDHREQLLPVLLRLLYGRIVKRGGSAKGAQESRRKAVFVTLTRFGDDVVRQFLDIGLGRLSDARLVSSNHSILDLTNQELIEPRKQSGLLNMLRDMIDTLATQMRPQFDMIVSPILFCTLQASEKLEDVPNGSDAPQGPDVDSEKAIQTSLLRSIRQTGVQCLATLIRIDPTYEWEPYVSPIIQRIVKPRLEKLPIETAQSISGLLRLFSAWSSSIHTALFLSIDPNILGRTAKCLGLPTAKEDVKLFVLRDIIQPLIKICKDEANSPLLQDARLQIHEKVIAPNSTILLSQIGHVLRSDASRTLLEVAAETLSPLADFIQEESGSSEFIDVCCYLLQQPLKRVNPRTKSEVLEILRHFIRRCDLADHLDLFTKTFEALSALFSFFNDRVSRERLNAAFRALSDQNNELKEVANLCEDLNSYAENRMDEPDFQRRLAAFCAINEEKFLGLSAVQWRPLIYNMLYFVKDPEELAIRTNASFGLRRFVEAIVQRPNDAREPFMRLLQAEILPSIFSGIRSATELVRAEYLVIVAAIVRNFPDWEKVQDMHGLLMGNDEEASFFTNILHIQQHRRLRALKRLSAAAAAGQLSAGSTYTFLIPLLEHFVFDQEDSEASRALAGETINVIGVLCGALDWSQYRALLRRFTGYVESKPDMQKTIVKLLGAVIDTLNRAAKARGYIGTSVDTSEEETATMEVDTPPSNLAKSLPSKPKLSQELISNILPAMTGYLHHKDEATVSLRVPVAIATTKVLQLLPEEEYHSRLPSILMDVCNILRSRASESRDMARKTLAEVSSIVGPSYFGFILKALRNALQRGYQMHVLSYTVHSILLESSSNLKAGDLDGTVKDIVAVIMDDIFGVTGQEKDSSEYISKMKEVKSSKSFDSMEIISKLTTLSHLADLVRPIQALLQEKLNIKVVKKIDELLRRIGLGISQNEVANDRGILVFCYEIIQEAHRAQTASGQAKQLPDYKTRRYLVNMNGAKGAVKGTTSSHLYKTTRFALDLLRATLRRHLSLQTASNLAGFMPAVHDALVTGQEEVQISALRLLNTIIKMQWSELDDQAPEYIYHCVRMVKASPSTNTEIAQAALKLVAATLRDRRNFTVKENDVAYLIKQIKPDLEEPDRQGVTFNFLKAVLGRKVIITEVYEILDSVSRVMITNQMRSTRDLARGVYFQFLVEYPQKKNRFDKQVHFLISNLNYDHIEGRQSVMEAFHLILSKFGDDLVADVIKSAFVPLVMAMTNDHSKDCREMAGVLLKKVFERSSSDLTKEQKTYLRNWLQPNQPSLLQRVALQCWMLSLEVHHANSKDIAFILENISRLLSESVDSQDDDAWEMLYFALQAFSSVCQAAPEVGLSSKQGHIWTLVERLLSYPHAWVKGSAAKLLSKYFADLASENKSAGLQHLPLMGSGGLKLDGNDMLEIASASLRAFKVRDVSEELSKQMAQNLLFLGRCFAANELRQRAMGKATPGEVTDPDASSTDEDEEENEAVAPAAPSEASKPALQVMFERLSSILRKDVPHTREPALYPKSASMQIIGALCRSLSGNALSSCLPTILLPLHNLTDPSIPAPSSLDDGFNETYKTLKGAAQEIMDGLKEKFGTTAFVEAYQEVRRSVQERREGRKTKRKIDAVTRPEKVGEMKRRKREGERKKRKEKNLEFRGRRRGY